MRPIVRLLVCLVSAAICAVFMPHRGGVQAASQDRTLSVAVSTSCEAMVPAYCQGRFGFRTTADGAFIGGPAPDGRLVSGYLREGESRALRSAARQVLAGINALSVECHISPEIPGVEESVVVLAQDRTVVLHGAGGLLGRGCAPGDAMADARLFALADRLMRRYYPNPF